MINFLFYIYILQIDFADNNDIIVQFTLLDKAPQIGNWSVYLCLQDIHVYMHIMPWKRKKKSCLVKGKLSFIMSE
jgi:hypothetical protein